MKQIKRTSRKSTELCNNKSLDYFEMTQNLYTIITLRRGMMEPSHKANKVISISIKLPFGQFYFFSKNIQHGLIIY